MEAVWELAWKPYGSCIEPARASQSQSEPARASQSQPEPAGASQSQPEPDRAAACILFVRTREKET